MEAWTKSNPQILLPNFVNSNVYGVNDSCITNETDNTFTFVESANFSLEILPWYV